jgi:GTP:adenosylcobinamide-phosphate guanylyltransferase
MDAIVTAGGIPQPGEPLYEYSRGGCKALLDVAGKPMAQWVLDALSASNEVDDIVLIGLEPDSGVTCTKKLYFLPNQGSMIENLLAGIREALAHNPDASHVLAVSSDIPAVKGTMVDWVIQTAMETQHDFYYNVVTRQVMEKRFPNSNRSYTRLKDAELCGGDMNVVRTITSDSHQDLWNKIVDSRKNVFKQAALIGYDTLFLLLLRAITVEQAAARVSKRLNIRGRAVICPYAEVAMDVDKPHQLEILRADLAGRASP